MKFFVVTSEEKILVSFCFSLFLLEEPPSLYRKLPFLYQATVFWFKSLTYLNLNDLLWSNSSGLNHWEFALNSPGWGAGDSSSLPFLLTKLFLTPSSSLPILGEHTIISKCGTSHFYLVLADRTVTVPVDIKSWVHWGSHFPVTIKYHTK